MLEINPKQIPEKMGHFHVEGPAGKIEVLTERPKSGHFDAIAVICHPNPVQEGSMTNKVVHTLGKAYQHCGLLSVRFNFRGVGQSEGEFGQTVGEIQDLAAVIDWVREVEPNLPLWLAGFSFGAFVAAKGAQSYPVEHLISVAPAVHLHPYHEVQDLTCPWLIIQGDQDEVVSPEAVYQFYETVQAQSGNRATLAVLEGVGHFFHGRLLELRELVESNCRKYL